MGIDSEQLITVSFDDRHGKYSLHPEGAEQSLRAITGVVDRGAWVALS